MPEADGKVVLEFPDTETFLVFSGLFKLGCETVVPVKGPQYWFRLINDANRRIDEKPEAFTYCTRMMADKCLELIQRQGQ